MVLSSCVQNQSINWSSSETMSGYEAGLGQNTEYFSGDQERKIT